MASKTPIKAGETPGYIIEQFQTGDTVNPSFIANGIPVGGTAAQVLAKVDGSDYNAQWVNQSGGGGITEIAYSDLFDLVSNNTVQEGVFYLVSDAGGADLGFVTVGVASNAIAADGTGGYLNCDFQATGDYSGVEAITGVPAGSQRGIWSETGEGTWFDGDFAIWNLSHYQLTNSAAIDGTDPATNAAAYTQLLRTDPAQGYITVWDISEYNFAGNAIVARQDSRANLVKGSANIAAFTWGSDAFTGNVANSALIDLKNCTASVTNNVLSPGSEMSAIETGADSVIANNILLNGATMTGITAGATSTISRNTVGQGATVGTITGGDSMSIVDNEIGNAGSITSITTGTSLSVSANVLSATGSITDITAGDGFSLDNNRLASNAVIGNGTTASDNSGITSNTLGSTAIISEITMGSNSLIGNNTVGPFGTIERNELADNAQLSDNILLQSSRISDNTVEGIIARNTVEVSAGITLNTIGIDGGISACSAGVNSSISSNVLGEESVISGIILAGGIVVSAKTLDDGVALANKTIGVQMTATETISAELVGTRAIPGFSDIQKDIDATGATTLAFGAPNVYAGIFNVSSTNATETIDAFTNAPTAFPIQIRPAAGLALTITGTSVASAIAGEFVLTTASVTLDGDKGEYIEMEIDSAGVGVLVERRRVVGIV